VTLDTLPSGKAHCFQVAMLLLDKRKKWLTVMQLDMMETFRLC
jgi:hypothetical protein